MVDIVDKNEGLNDCPMEIHFAGQIFEILRIGCDGKLISVNPQIVEFISDEVKRLNLRIEDLEADNKTKEQMLKDLYE